MKQVKLEIPRETEIITLRHCSPQKIYYATNGKQNQLLVWKGNKWIWEGIDKWGSTHSYDSHEMDSFDYAMQSHLENKFYNYRIYEFGNLAEFFKWYLESDEPEPEDET